MSEVKLYNSGDGKEYAVTEVAVFEIQSASTFPASALQQSVVKSTTITTEYVPWGSDNLFPQNVAKEVRKSTIVPATLDRIARMIYGGGLVWGTLDVNAKGEEIFTPMVSEYPEIKQWLRRTNYERFIMGQALDFVWFRNTFPSLILSLNRKEVVGIKRNPAMDCRWGKQNQQTGLIEKCIIDANWIGSDRSFARTIDVIDPLFDTVEKIKEGSAYEFIYPTSYVDVDNKFYHLADWDSARTSGWIKFSLKVPEFKSALMDNQMTIKYHLKVSPEYWAWKYPNYDAMTVEEKNTVKTAFVQEFNQKMKGTDKAGISILSLTKLDNMGKEIPGLSIEPIDNKIKDGIYIEDSNEASTHILTSLGVDPTLTGNGPGKNFGAGSGSDKRVAYNIYMSSIRPWQDLLLQIFGVVRDYNGWDPELVFRFRNSLVSTLDSGKETQTKTN